VSRKNPVESFSRAYAAASPDEQAALRVWMRNMVLPQKERRRDVAKARRSEKDRIEAGDRRILEFPPSTSPRTVAKVLKAEGWYSPKTTTYYIEYRIRRLRARVHRETSSRLVQPHAEARYRREQIFLDSPLSVVS
jgi:hypothetical protein